MQLSLTLDLGSTPSVLAALGDARTLQRVVYAAAESYTDDVLDWIRDGKSFTPRHGGAGLEGAINWRPAGNGAAEVTADKDYASYVEEGTPAHVIRPKDRKALKINVSGGGYVLRREVHHPGSKPFPFMFADQAARESYMLAAARLVLAQELSHG